MLSFGERLAVLRRRQGLTQSAVASQAGISPNTLARVERGKVQMLRGDTVALLADTLDTTTDYLLGRVQNPAGIPVSVSQATSATAPACERT
jgi:transcriptional regulator with XRE-family HTH domain